MRLESQVPCQSSGALKLMVSYLNTVSEKKARGIVRAIAQPNAITRDITYDYNLPLVPKISE